MRVSDLHTWRRPTPKGFFAPAFLEVNLFLRADLLSSPSDAAAEDRLEELRTLNHGKLVELERGWGTEEERAEVKQNQWRNPSR